MRIVAATNNVNKVREIKKIFEPLGFEVVSQHEAGIDVDVEETGRTFERNALLKARAVAMLCDDCVMADDSGLCVEALDGRPGVYSARYAGEGASDAQKIEKLLGEMKDEKNRRAKFVTSMAFIFPDGREIVTKGEVNGRIIDKPEGENGFGYDPVFYCPELGKTFAQADDDEKNSVSHRGRALKALYGELKQVVGDK
ncbi:MAG: XTP/dITP diphosphatase [Clostridiales bacterium]|nr:XTP/dITP diphosphatase [Clostridiales bacterium]